MTPDRVIGKGGDLPWHLPEDLKFFKKTTLNAPIVMGRKTYESIGKPLPKRQNIVITRDINWNADGVTVVNTIAEVRDLIADQEKAFIIGGSEIYSLFLPELDELIVSHVKKNYAGDVIFPEYKKYFKLTEVVAKYNDFVVKRYF